MLGDDKLDIATASDPLDFSLARGFLTMARYKAAMAFAEAHHRARLGGPSEGRGGQQETSTTIADQDDAFRRIGRASKNQWDRMSRPQIAAVFDAVFNVSGAVDPEAAAAEGLDLWKAMNAALSPDQRSELYAVCVRRSWPQWVVFVSAGKPVAPGWDRHRVLLETGLDAVAAMLRDRAKSRAPAVQAQPARRPYTGPIQRDGRAEEHLLYVDEEGEAVPTQSEHGVPFEVARLARRAP